MKPKSENVVFENRMPTLELKGGNIYLDDKPLYSVFKFNIEKDVQQGYTPFSKVYLGLYVNLEGMDILSGEVCEAKYKYFD